MPESIETKHLQYLQQVSDIKEVYHRQGYTFTFSKQHKLFNDNTQNILNDISIDKGINCYLNYIEKSEINTQKIKYNY
jgi:hypothetical protein